MAISVGEIEGTLRLRDEFSVVFAKFSQTMGQVSGLFQQLGKDIPLSKSAFKEFEFAVGASIGAVVAVTAAVIAADTAIIKLASAGSRINDIEQAFERLTKSMGVDTAAAVDNLRKGVAGLVDDTDMMAAANKAMGAGLKLTTEQFAVLGEAARALAKQGGMPVKDAFDLVLNSLTTGRARALQAAGAFIELKGASAELKAQLAAENEGMSTGADLTAKRKAVLEALSGIVKNATLGERNFGEQIQATRVAITNWIEELEKAIAASPVLNAALAAIGKELQLVFGGESQALIKSVVGWIEFFAQAQIQSAKGILSMAGYVNQAWEGIRSVVLLAATAIVGVVDLIGKTIVAAETLAGKLHLVSPGEVAAMKENQAALDNYTRGLWEQTKTAAAAAAGHGEFQGQLDKGKAALERISFAMTVASGTADAHKKIVHGVTQTIGESNQMSAEQVKAIEELKKSLIPLTAIQAEIIQQAVRLGQNVQLVAKAHGISTEAASQYEATLKQLKVVETDNGEALQKLAEQSRITFDETKVDIYTKKVHEIQEGFYGIGSSIDNVGEKLKPAMDDLVHFGKVAGVDFIALGEYSTKSLQRIATEAQGTYLVAKSASGDYSAAAIEHFRQVAVAAQEAANGARSWASTLVDALKGIPALIAQAFTGGGGLGGAAQGIASMFGSLGIGKIFDSLGKSIGGMVGSLMGPIGAAVGSLVGPLISMIAGLFDHTGADVMRDVGINWGVHISKGLRDAIVKDVKGGMTEVAAELAHMGQIIGEAGGLTGANLPQLTARLHDVFSMIETHQLTIAQGTKIINENWQAFVAAGVDADGRLSESLKQIIALDEKFGTQSKQIADYLKAQGATALDAFIHVAAGAAKSQQALADMGTQAIATFTAAVASGMSYADALAKIAPTLATLKKSYDDLGLAVDDVGFRTLMLQADIITNNPIAVKAISALTTEMIALDNMGLLTIDTFKAMQRTGVQNYTQIQATVHALGGTTKDALAQMQTYLHQAAKEAELLGIPLDANTQMLIDQSKELGLWKDAGKSATDKLTDAMTALVDKVKELIDKLSGVPTSIPAPWAGWSPPPEIPNYGGGTPPIFGPEVFVPSPRLAVVGTGSGEVVLHKETYDTLMHSEGGADWSAVLTELGGIREELARQRSLLPMAVRDAVQRA